MNRLLICGATFLSISAPALSQSTLVWTDTVAPSASEEVQDSSVRAHPDGGAVHIMAIDDTPGIGPATVRARRLTETGDQVWSIDVPPPAVNNLFFSKISHSIISTRGSTATVQDELWGVEAIVSSIDTAGSFEWQVTLTSGIANQGLRVSSLGTTPTGDILVAGMAESYFMMGTEAVVVFSLDGASGAIQWTYSAPTVSASRTNSATMRDGRTYLSFYDSGGLRVDCVDASGALVYSTPNIFGPGAFSASSIFLETTASGELVTCFGFSSNPTGSHLIRLDAIGNVLWQTVAIPATSSAHQDGTLTSDGEIVLLDLMSINGTLSSKLTRLDANGQFLWDHAAPPGIARYLNVIRDESGGVIASCNATGGAFPGRPALEFVDASGTTTDVETLGFSPGDIAFRTTPSVDANDNVWVGHITAVTGTSACPGTCPDAARAAKLVIGDPGASTTCTPSVSNSTGTLSRLRAAGSSAASEGNLTLIADQLPAGQFVLFLNSRTPGLVPNPGGSAGTLCLGGAIGRFVGPGEIRQSDGGGMASLPLDLTSIPNGVGSVAVLPGDTWHFQGWHRDVGTSNLTGAIEVLFN